VNNIRATYDQKVIDAWAAQLLARRRGMGRVLLALVITLAILLALMFLTHKAIFVLLFFCIATALIFSMLMDRSSLTCPHCGKPPLTKFERGPATTADFYPHCYYWLKSPCASK
jgi:hypothetical protein